jgi:hypothetical protein
MVVRGAFGHLPWTRRYVVKGNGKTKESHLSLILVSWPRARVPPWFAGTGAAPVVAVRSRVRGFSTSDLVRLLTWSLGSSLRVAPRDLRSSRVLGTVRLVSGNEHLRFRTVTFSGS